MEESQKTCMAPVCVDLRWRNPPDHTEVHANQIEVGIENWSAMHKCLNGNHRKDISLPMRSGMEP